MEKIFPTTKRLNLLILMIFMIGLQSTAHAAEPLPTRIETIFPLGLTGFADMDSTERSLVGFGEFLFASPLLSYNQEVSCRSCHVAQFGYADSHPLAVGVDGQVGRRRAPPLFNLFGAKALMLDGRAAGLGDQIHIPLESPDEMAIDWPAALGRLKNLPETKQLLAARPKTVLDRGLVLGALAAYARTLVAGDSAFDRYYFNKDETAISDEAKAGLTLFVRKGRCAGCHQVNGMSAMLTDHNFHATGIGFAGGKYRDTGRFEVTGAETDRGAFKTPTLRNVALRPYFMHDGSMSSLREVMDYYNRGGNHGAPNLDGRIQPLYLNETEIQEIVAFLGTLDSEVVSYRPWLKGTGAGH
jgi:cytochrome c peroxidase